MIKKYIIIIVLFLGYSISAQTSKQLIEGTNSSQNIRAKKSIQIQNKKVQGLNTSKDKILNSQSNSSSNQELLKTSQVGRTPANFTVSLSGGVNYNIPIATPQGIRDIHPNVSLAFNSQASNDIAGWGWNIGGLSAIKRISSTTFHDGAIDGVDFDENDRFVIDGQRLLIKTGTYGAAGSEYQTEKYSNVKIRAFGTSPYGASYGPSYFVVNYPDGSRSWYGNSGGSRGRMEWAIFKKQDPQGNFIQYNYIQTNNLKTLDKITFGSRVGVSAPIEIKFYYKDRKRTELAYVNDIEFKRTNILERIEVKGNGQLFKKYLLTHDETSLGYERLISVQEFNKNNDGLTPIVFTYQDSPSSDFLTDYSGSIYPGYNYQTDEILSGEFNGDGKMDFILYNKNIQNHISVFDNIYSTSSNIDVGSEYDVPPFDKIIGNKMLNDEGKLLEQQGLTFIAESISGSTANVDFTSYYTGPAGSALGYLYYQYTKTWNAQTNNYQNTPTSSTQKIIPKEFISGDFNGDGLTDVIAIGKPYTSKYCSEHECPDGGGGGDPEPKQQEDESDTDFKVRKNKFKETNNSTNRLPPPLDPDDGDGGNSSCYTCTTYTVNEKSLYFIDLNRNLTSGFVARAGSLQEVLEDNDKLLTADFNGDGKTNLFHFKSGEVYIYEIDSNRSLVLIHHEPDSLINLDRPIVFGDYNGDGKIDFLVPTANGSSVWKFFLSTGNDILKYTKNLIGAITYYDDYINDNYYFPSSGYIIDDALMEHKYIAQDFNGDGKSDIGVHTTATGNYSIQNEIIPSRYWVIIYENVFDEVDEKTNFQRGSFFSESDNSGVTRYGIPILTNDHSRTGNVEYAYISSNTLSVFEFEHDHKKDLLLEEINNNGLKHEIDYHELNSQIVDPESIYTENHDQVYPYVNINILPSLKLVEEVREVGSGQTRTQNYRYSSAVSHAHGLGFIGFGQIKKSNFQGYGVQTLWNISDYDVSNRGATKQSWTSLNASSSPYSYINKENYTYETQITSDNVFINVPSLIISQNNLTGVTENKSYIYDEFYNPLTITNSVPGSNSVVNYTYHNNSASTSQYYHIGRPTNKTETRTQFGNTFNTEQQYLYSNNLITSVKKKGNSTPWLAELSQYDSFGNKTKKTIEGVDFADRVENYEFDTSGRFMKKSIDNQGLETNYTYNINTGNPLTVTNSFGQALTYVYDDWNRVSTETDYLGNLTTYTYDNTTLYGTGGTLKTTNYDNGQDSKSFYNALGWVMKKGILSLNNNWIYKSYEYDIAGNKLKESEPYFESGSPSQWNQYYFDQYGRPITQQHFTGKIINTTYNGLSTTIDDGVKTVVKTSDASGNLLSSQDPGGTITYTYYGDGSMKSASLGTHVVNITVDGWGRKIGLNDPSAGNYTYQYNSIGDMLVETTPKGSTTYTYDDFGRIILKEISGDETGLSLQYNYDAISKLLKSINGSDIINAKTYNYLYGYDSDNRIESVKENHDTANYEKQTIYDPITGRVTSENYITNDLISGINSEVKIKNIYSSIGILVEIRDFDTNNLLWKINAENERGQALSIDLGNGITKTKQYDSYGSLTNIEDYEDVTDGVQALKMDYSFNNLIGSLTSRKNYAFSNWEENFTYDNLNRLTNISGAVSHSQDYDGKGRITNNSHVGDYNYNAATTYRLANVDLNNQGDLYYQQNKLQEITYNAFKKPVEIHQQDKGRVSFEYGPLRNRTHAYYGGLEEDKTLRQYHKQYSSIIPVEVINDNTGSTKIITYIAGDGYTAPIAHIKTSVLLGTGIDEYHYLHRDYLGSILAVTDSNTNLVEERQFGAWGVVDNFKDADGNTTFSHNSILGRGFTGHEHFFQVSLIHMNGRMYDAKLGRFLSPDNFIQDPYNTQSFNRYGYVWNNPLSYNDASGEWIWAAALAGAVIGAVAGASAYANNALQSGNWDWGAFGIAVVGGAVVGGVTGGIGGTAAFGGGALWSAAASSVIGSYFSFTIPIGDWSISISPSFAFGNASGVGASLSAGYSDGTWSFSGGVGYMNYGNYNGFGNGTEIRYSILGAYDDGNTGFSLGTNWWRGSVGGGVDDFHQRTGLIGFKSGDFKIRYENDGSIGFLGDDGDSYRTASLQLSVGEFSAGFQLFTGYRNFEKETSRRGEVDIGDYGRKFPHGFVEEDDTKYRLGALTFGYKGYSAGVNSEHVRHAIQTRVFHDANLPIIGDKRQRGFKNQSWDWKGYSQYKTPNAFTSW